MKRIIIATAVVVFACGVTFGQESVEPNPQLKCYGPFIGTWRYEGPLLENVTDVADQGADVVLQFNWRRILDKNAVEGTWSAEVAGKTYSGKNLFGWHAADKRIAFGGMDSMGGIRLGSVTPDEAAKSFTEVSEGVDADGAAVTSTVVIKKTGKDSLTWQALERKGGLIEGESPVYTFTRVSPAAKGAAAEQAQPAKQAPRRPQSIRQPQSVQQSLPSKKVK